MVRTIVRPDTPKVDISIPAEYIGKEIEILVFPVHNALDFQVSNADAEKQTTRRQEVFADFRKYKGTLPLDFDYKRELAEYRNP
jgi:hypothetical protein